MAMVESLRHDLLNAVLRATDYTAPTSVHVALSDGDLDSGGTEVSGTDYARVSASFGAPTSGTVENSSQVDFGTAGSGGWGDITHFAIYDAATGGNLLVSEALTASKTVSEGDSVRFPAGDLSVSLT